VLIIDDFLATGSTLSALVRLVCESQADLAGIGCVVEKPAEGGREVLSDVDAPILTLATIEFVGDQMMVY
jgi:xanthine phosphoribosyltransferase